MKGLSSEQALSHGLNQLRQGRLNYICITNLQLFNIHYNGVIMSTMASQITSLTIVYSTVYSGADQRKHQSSVSLAFVQGIHRWPVNSPHKGPVTREMFPFDDVIMFTSVVMSPVKQVTLFLPISCLFELPTSQYGATMRKHRHISWEILDDFYIIYI